MRKSVAVFLTACVMAAAVPPLFRSNVSDKTQPRFTGWPTTFAGFPLRRLPLSIREQELLKGFPGRVGRFGCGHSELVLRWVTAETRRLHPASDCYRALGYKVKPLSLFIDSEGARWGAFRATRAGKSVYVREQITNSAGQCFSDVSAWYWSALLGQTKGPWWAFTVVTSD